MVCEGTTHDSGARLGGPLALSDPHALVANLQANLFQKIYDLLAWAEMPWVTWSDRWSFHIGQPAREPLVFSRRQWPRARSVHAESCQNIYRVDIWSIWMESTVAFRPNVQVTGDGGPWTEHFWYGWQWLFNFVTQISRKISKFLVRHPPEYHIG
jgi:hypothetical protein